MSIGTTSNRGQIVIPKTIRNKLQIGPGKKLSITAEKDHAIIRPLPDDPVEAFCGVFQNRSSLTRSLIEERKKDRVRESKKTAR